MGNSHEAGLKSLAPRILTDDEYSAYEREFATVFSDSGIRNIALSGRYGAGKSSVMRSFEQRERDKPEGKGKKIVFVSLADFEEPGGAAERGPDSTAQDGGTHTAASTGSDLIRAEEKILVQLVHQLDSERTPKSRFGRTEDKGRFRDFIMAVALAAFASLSIALLRWFGKDSLGDSRALVLSCACIWCALLLALAYQLVRHRSLAGLLHTLKLGNFEVDLGELQDATPLDRYMDDLIYLVNASGCDVVVFEDLDRFGSVALFEKLREINDLSNAVRKDVERSPVRFFYLLRDGLFAESRDRTKFFDYIIPVIPYVDPSNAESTLMERLGERKPSVDKTFLYQLAFFVDDPRLLKDIANEFEHYERVVLAGDGTAITEEDSTRLLAIIAYKVMFPADFELLQVGRGCLHALLEKRGALVKGLARSKSERLAEVEQELGEIRSRNELGRAELTLLYGMKRIINLYGQYSPAGNAVRNAFSNSNPSDIVGTLQSGETGRGILAGIEGSLDGNAEYQERLQEAEEGTIKLSNRLLAERASLEGEIADLGRMRLADLLEATDSADDFFKLREEDFSRREDFEELGVGRVVSSPDYPLVRFLLMSGMVDESYRRYTSHFRPGGIDRADSDFVTAVLQGKGTSASQEFKDPGTVLLRLDARVLARPGARNWSLFEHLLLVGPGEKAESFLRGVGRDADHRFLAEYIASDRYAQPVFSVARSVAGIEVLDLVGDGSLDIGVRRDVCHRFMVDQLPLEEDDPELLEGLGDFASRDREFLSVRVADAEMLAQRLPAIGYAPKSIRMDVADDRLLRTVVDDGLLTPDAGLVSDLVAWDRGEAGPCPDSKLITEVRERYGERLLPTIAANLDLFVSTLLARVGDGVLEDDADSVSWVLDSEAVSDELSGSFASRERGARIGDLSVLASDVRKSQALEHDLVACTGGNVLCYVGAVGAIDDTVVGYLQRNGLPVDLDGEKCETLLGSASALADLMLTSPACIPDEMLESVVAACDTRYRTFDVKGAPPARVDLLIGMGCVDMTAENLLLIRESYPGCVHGFALGDFEGYLGILADDESDVFDEGEATIFLGDSTLPVAMRRRLLSYFPGTVRMSDAYPDEINADIADDHFSVDDLDAAIGMYGRCSGSLESAIVRRVHDNLSEVRMRSRVLPLRMVKGVLEMMPGRPQKRDFLVMQLSLSADDIILRGEVEECLSACEYGTLVEAMEGARIKFGASEVDGALVECLKLVGMLSDKCREEPDGTWMLYSRGVKRGGK